MTFRKRYTDDPQAWDMASRRSMSFDEYNPYKGFARRSKGKMTKFLYCLAAVMVLALAGMLLKNV